MDLHEKLNELYTELQTLRTARNNMQQTINATDVKIVQVGAKIELLKELIEKDGQREPDASN